MTTTSGASGPNAVTLLARITDSLANHDVVFAIGGAVDISSPEALAGEQSPLVVRWDSGGLNHARKVSFPTGSDAASTDAFSRLVEDCEPATFGHGTEEDLLDETYRKARKLGAAQFSTSFSPYEHGIMDTVTQALVHTDYRGIRAELYNLKIHSAPSGKFKPHVVTPRSKEQMGSLVVCLPHPHKGGQLAVRHRGQEVLFDWASKTDGGPSTVQWAAFFADCEHEVLEVTDGHRLTLTYNLYWTPQGPASMADHLGALEPESLPFFSALRELIACPLMLPTGGRLGFTCTHAYPHISGSIVESPQKGLKGLDMVVYQALMSLVDSIQVVSVLDDEKNKSQLGGYEYGLQDRDLSNVLVGRLPAAPTLTVRYTEDELLDPELVHEYYTPRGVVWLNHAPPSGSSEEFAVALIVNYGNGPARDGYYSSAAIVAKLGPWDGESGSRQRAVESEED